MKDLEKFKSKLSQIKLIAIEVDGVLTDGRVWQAADGQFRRVFSIRDAMGIRLLMKSGYRVVFFSHEASDDISRHAQALGVDLFVASDMAASPISPSVASQSLASSRRNEIRSGSVVSGHSLCADLHARFRVQANEILSFFSAGSAEDASMGNWPNEVLKCSVAKAKSAQINFLCRGEAGEGVVRELSQILLKFRKAENEKERTTASL